MDLYPIPKTIGAVFLWYPYPILKTICAESHTFSISSLPILHHHVL